MSEQKTGVIGSKRGKRPQTGEILRDMRNIIKKHMKGDTTPDSYGENITMTPYSISKFSSFSYPTILRWLRIIAMIQTLFSEYEVVNSRVSGKKRRTIHVMKKRG